MSWSQDYRVPSLMELLESLTGKDSLTLLEKALALQGIEIVKTEDVLLDDGDAYGPVMGKRVQLSDGRVFVPKLVERFSEDGNHGIDTYQYFLEGETPKISYTGSDSAEPGTDETVIYEHCCDVVDISDGPCGDPSHD